MTRARGLSTYDHNPKSLFEAEFHSRYAYEGDDDDDNRPRAVVGATLSAPATVLPRNKKSEWVVDFGGERLLMKLDVDLGREEEDSRTSKRSVRAAKWA